MKQVELTRQTSPNSIRKMITWLSEEGLKEDMIISLKGCQLKWRVSKVYDLSINKDDINRNWNVGGL